MVCYDGYLQPVMLYAMVFRYTMLFPSAICRIVLLYWVIIAYCVMISYTVSYSFAMVLGYIHNALSSVLFNSLGILM